MDNTGRNLIVALVILLLVALALSSTMGGVMGPDMMWRGGGWMWGGGMWLGSLVMLVFWGALIRADAKRSASHRGAWLDRVPFSEPGEEASFNARRASSPHGG